MRILLKNLLTTLRRYSTAVLLNIAGLSVAFTAFVVILMQLCYEWSFDRHIPDAERVFRVELGYDGEFQTIFSQPLIEDLTAVSAHIETGTLLGIPENLDTDLRVVRPNGTQEVFRIEGMTTTPAIVPTLGLELTEGSAEVLNTADEVLIPESVARKLFPDQPAVGQKLLGETMSLTVGGVYRDHPENSVIPNYLLQGHPWRNHRGNYNYLYFIRLDDPAAVPDVAEAMRLKTREFMGVSDDEPATSVSIRLVNIRDIYFERDVTYEFFPKKGSRTTSDVLLGFALLVIVIASINFVNFASALTPVRMKMINLQKILGAGVRQLRLSLLFEAVAIALTAYVVALVFVACLSQTPFTQYVSADISPAANLPLLGWCTLVALVVGLAAGLHPAVYMTSFPPILAIKGSFGTSASGRRYRMVLVGVQFVISIGLIIATVFLNLQNRYLTHLEMGYDTEQVAVIELSYDLQKRYETLSEKLKSHAAVEDVAFARQKFGAEESGYMGWGRRFKDIPEAINYKVLVVSDNFLRVLGIPVTEGRDFTSSDPLRASCTYIFNQTARKRWNMQLGDYIGEQEFDSDGRHSVGWGEIVGFFPEDVHIVSQHADEDPFAFTIMGVRKWGGMERFCYVRIAAGADLMEVSDHIRRTLGDLSPFAHDIEFLDTVVNNLYRAELKTGVLVTAFSALAILLSLTGVFGLVLFETQYRRKEIGIRKVNGATSGSILWMFNRRFAAIVAVSFLIAAPLAAYAVTQWLRNFRSAVPLYGWVFAAAFVLVLAITVTTVTVRSWRTAAENPVKSVKSE